MELETPYPTDQELMAIAKVHAPNQMGHTLIQRVANQLACDCTQAIKVGDVTLARKLAYASVRLDKLANSKSFEEAYQIALVLFEMPEVNLAAD